MIVEVGTVLHLPEHEAEGAKIKSGDYVVTDVFTDSTGRQLVRLNCSDPDRWLFLSRFQPVRKRCDSRHPERPELTCSWLAPHSGLHMSGTPVRDPDGHRVLLRTECWS